jgi:hypothetical protein
MYCDKCSAPIDPAYDSTISAADGTFTLPIDDVPAGATVDFAIQIGRFRKHTLLPVTKCTTAAVPMAAETLPGNSAAGDIPKIAVSTGNTDHLDQILTALGITEWDCYEGRTYSGGTGCTPAMNPATNSEYNIGDLLTDGGMSPLAAYNMLFVSCAPGGYAYYTGKAQYAASKLTPATQTWVANGGRMFVTDTSYDYVAQAFPSDITWQVAKGSVPGVDTANVGCSPPNNTNGPPTPYTVTIDDPTLATWLALPVNGLNFTTSPTVQVDGFYEPWSAMASLPPTTTKIADGTMPLDLVDTAKNACSTTMNEKGVDVPLTAEFDVPTCGRVVFSSYHTYDKASTGNVAVANSAIMEYLIFGIATCHH